MDTKRKQLQLISATVILAVLAACASGGSSASAPASIEPRIAEGNSTRERAATADGSATALIGFSLYTYGVDPEDLVFPDPYAHRIPILGFRGSFLRGAGQTVKTLVDVELLGIFVEREISIDGYRPFNVGGFLWGYQIYVGPAFNRGRLSGHVAIGINRVAIEGGTPTEGGPGIGPNIIYTGRGVSGVWASYMNNLSSGGSRPVEPELPDYWDRSFGALIGGSYGIVTFGPEHDRIQLRILGDYTPLFRGTVRHNFRVSLMVGQ